jgi:hypothetical protein
VEKITMKNISLTSGKNQLVITVDTSDLDQDYLLIVLEKIELEILAQKAQVKDSALDIAEQLNEDWWRENRDNYLRGIKQ